MDRVKVFKLTSVDSPSSHPGLYTVPPYHVKMAHRNQLQNEIVDATSLPVEQANRVINSNIDSILKLNENSYLPSIPNKPKQRPKSPEKLEQQPKSLIKNEQKTIKKAVRPSSLPINKKWLTEALESKITSDTRLERARGIIKWMENSPDLFTINMNNGSFQVDGLPQDVNLLDLIVTITGQKKPDSKTVDVFMDKFLANKIPKDFIVNKHVNKLIQTPPSSPDKSSTPVRSKRTRVRRFSESDMAASPELRDVLKDWPTRKKSRKLSEDEDESGEEESEVSTEFQPNKKPTFRRGTPIITPVNPLKGVLFRPIRNDNSI